MLRLRHFALLTFIVAACQSQPPGTRASPGQARVLQVSPAAGEVTAEALRAGIRIVFDRAVAPPSEIGRRLAAAVRLEPALAGESRWLDAQTLVFFPKDKPARSTRYRVTLGPELQTTWEGSTFVHDRLAITGVRFDGDLEFQRPQPVVTLQLSQKVDPKSALAACAFYETRADGSAGKKTAAQVATPAASEERLQLRPEEPLRLGTKHTFQCSSALKPREGNEGLANAMSQAFSTYGPAGTTDIGPRGRDLAADDVHVRVAFATPMPPQNVRTHVTLKQVGGADVPMDLAADRRQLVFTWSGDLEPGSEYELVVAEGVKDRFGQTLAHEIRHAFRVGDASPRLRMQTGIYVAERSAPHYPVWTRNLPRFAVRCAAVPESRLAALLTGPANYDAWWDASNKGDVDYAALGLKLRERTITPGRARNQWHDARFDLRKTCDSGVGKPALYLVAVHTDDEVGAREGVAVPRDRQSLVNVTDLGLLAKVGNASSLVWVVRLSDGAPVAGAVVRIRDLNGKVRFAGTTNADGVVQGPGAAKLTGGMPPQASGDNENDVDFGGLRARRVLISAQTSDDFAVVDTNWNNGVQIWNFGVDEDRSGGQVRVRGFLHSDRGLYRPGDTVHLHGLVRVLDVAGRMTIPRTRKVHVVITDPKDAVVAEEDVPASGFGGFSRDLALGEDAPLGDYTVSATVEGQTFRERFAVEEYRPRTFEVKVNAKKHDAFFGDQLGFDVVANYLYGSPLGGGKLAWSVRKREHLPRFPGHEVYVFSDFMSQRNAGRWWARDDERSFSEPVADGEQALPATGKVSLTVRDPADKPSAPQDYLFEATVTDATGQTVSVSHVVRGHLANLYLGLHPAEVVQAVDMPFAVQVVGFDSQGTRRAAAAELTLTRRMYDCGTRQGSWWSCGAKMDAAPAVKRKVVVPASGSAAVERVVLREPGEYVVRVAAPDGRGVEAVASDVIWVVGPGEAFWSGDEGERMTVVASKARYAPGEIARLVPQAQLPGARALVTLERDGVLSYQVRTLATTGEALQIPIEPRLAPNVFASVVLVRGRTGEGDKNRPRFKMGVVNLTVEGTLRRLHVDVATERPSYEPGETVKARVKVTDAAGTPVRAEVALAAADEGVLQIAGYKTPDPWPVFYAPYGLGVETATTWNRLLQQMDPAVEAEEGGDGGGDEAGRVRSRFVATVYWNPALVTKADGTAEVSFVAPDNLTAFRVMAAVADAGDRFGAGEQRFTVKKALQVQPALPRFLSVGDEIQAAVLVQNNTDQAMDVAVTFTAAGVDVKSAAPQTVKVAASAKVRLTFAVVARAEGTAAFTFTCAAGKHRDAVTLSLPVTRPATGETLIVGEGRTAGAVSLSLPELGPVLPGRSELEVVLDTTGLGRLDEGLRYLIGYPYGCLEQTTSQVVPMVALTDLVKTVPINGVDAPRARALVSKGIAKILRHQHTDGGFGLWMGTPPETHYTAYALWGLHVARTAGYTVAAGPMDAAAAYLKRALAERSAGGGLAQIYGQQSERAFAEYVLAELGQGDAAALAALYEERAQLPLYGKAFLARALKKVKRADLAQALVGEFPLGLTAGPTLVREGGEDLGWYWSSDVRTSALVLLALLDVMPGHASVARLADGLLGAREGGRWANTQENLYAMLALAAVGKARATGGAATVTVSLAGKERLRRTLTGAAIHRLSLPLGAVGAGSVVLTSAGGEVFYEARLRVQRRLQGEAVDKGLAIERAYVDPETDAPLTKVKLGQAVKVVLRVRAPQKLSHVAVVDRLPAGLEPVLTRFHRSYTGDEGTQRGLWWWASQTQWQNQALHDDRAEMFADVLVAGESVQTYVARATTVGTFAAPAATVEAMYRPQLHGRSSSTTFVVER